MEIFDKAFMAMYELIKLRVEGNGSLGQEFKTNLGTKQGCPLSPSLFGLLIEQLDEHQEPNSFIQYSFTFLPRARTTNSRYEYTRSTFCR